jgi:ketosteroid isomerase-like protein
MSTATSGTAAAIVRQFYELLGAGKFEEASQFLHEDLVVHESPALPYGGDYHGKAGFAELGARLTEGFDAAPTGAVDYIDAGDKVIVRIPSRFTWRATGQSVEMNVVEVATLQNGQIVDLDVYYKDPGALSALAA